MGTIVSEQCMESRKNKGLCAYLADMRKAGFIVHAKRAIALFQKQRPSENGHRARGRQTGPSSQRTSPKTNTAMAAAQAINVPMRTTPSHRAEASRRLDTGRQKKTPVTVVGMIEWVFRESVRGGDKNIGPDHGGGAELEQGP